MPRCPSLRPIARKVRRIGPPRRDESLVFEPKVDFHGTCRLNIEAVFAAPNDLAPLQTPKVERVPRSLVATFGNEPGYRSADRWLGIPLPDTAVFGKEPIQDFPVSSATSVNLLGCHDGGTVHIHRDGLQLRQAAIVVNPEKTRSGRSCPDPRQPHSSSSRR